MVIVVDGAPADAFACVLDEGADLLLGARDGSHAPGFATLAQGVAHVLVLDVEVTDAPLGDVTLQELVATDSQIHPLGVGADECVVLVEEEVDTLGDFGFDFAIGQGRFATLDAPGVERVNERHALGGVDAAQGNESGRPEENSADARLERACFVAREELGAKLKNGHLRGGHARCSTAQTAA